MWLCWRRCVTEVGLWGFKRFLGSSVQSLPPVVDHHMSSQLFLCSTTMNSNSLKPYGFPYKLPWWWGVLSQKWKSLDVGIIWNKQLAQKPIWPCVSTFMCFGSHRFGGEVHWACVMRCGWRCASAQSLRFQMLFLVFSRIIMDEAALHLSDKCNTVTVNLNRGAFQTNSGADYRCWTVWECIKAILVWSGVGKVGSY